MRLVPLAGLVVAGFAAACSPAPGDLVPTSTSSAALMTSSSVSVAPAAPRTSFVMPDLTGMYWTDADPSLRALGWTGALVKGPDLPNSSSRRNTIAVQSPAPGQLVGNGVTITVQFAS
jgi:beta-lactam-binding protein with PASTA domain